MGTKWARGEAPLELAQHLAGATLHALPKGTTDVRPIAVGETLRRLVAKCLCSHVKSEARDWLSPLQVGVAVPLGAEAAVHSSRHWVWILSTRSIPLTGQPSCARCICAFPPWRLGQNGATVQPPHQISFLRWCLDLWSRGAAGWPLGAAPFCLGPATCTLCCWPASAGPSFRLLGRCVFSWQPRRSQCRPGPACKYSSTSWAPLEWG